MARNSPPFPHQGLFKGGLIWKNDFLDGGLFEGGGLFQCRVLIKDLQHLWIMIQFISCSLQVYLCGNWV